MGYDFVVMWLHLVKLDSQERPSIGTGVRIFN